MAEKPNPTIIIRGGKIIVIGNGDGGSQGETSGSLDIVNIFPGISLDEINYSGKPDPQKMSYIRKGRIVTCTDIYRGDTLDHFCTFVFKPQGEPAFTIVAQINGFIEGFLFDSVNSQINGFVDVMLFLDLEIPAPDCDQDPLPQQMVVQGMSVQKEEEPIVPAVKFLSVQINNT